jgi:hypothetical protein
VHNTCYDDFPNYKNQNASSIQVTGSRNITPSSGDLDLLILAHYAHNKIIAAQGFIGDVLTTVSVVKDKLGNIYIFTNASSTNSNNLKIEALGGAGTHDVPGIGQVTVVNPNSVPTDSLPQWPSGGTNTHAEGVAIGNIGADDINLMAVSREPCSGSTKNCMGMLQQTYPSMPVMWTSPPRGK